MNFWRAHRATNFWRAHRATSYRREHHATGPADASALPEDGLRALGPGVLAGVSFGISDIFTKLALLAGMDALTLATTRGVFATLLVLAWLRGAPPAQRPPGGSG